MTPTETITLAALRAAGWNQTEAAAALGVSADAVQCRVRRSSTLLGAWRVHARFAGRPGRPPKHDSLTLDAVRAALAAHGTQTAAAKALGVSRQGVGAWVRRHPELREVQS